MSLEIGASDCGRPGARERPHKTARPPPPVIKFCVMLTPLLASAITTWEPVEDVIVFRVTVDEAVLSRTTAVPVPGERVAGDRDVQLGAGDARHEADGEVVVAAERVVVDQDVRQRAAGIKLVEVQIPAPLSGPIWSLLRKTSCWMTAASVAVSLARIRPAAALCWTTLLRNWMPAGAPTRARARRGWGRCCRRA